MSNVNNKPGIVKVTNFRETLNRLIATATGGTVDGYILISELFEETLIYIPSTQPTIVTGLTGEELGLNCNSRQQCKFDPTVTVSVNFEVILTNTTNTVIFSLTQAYTGTIVITFPSSFKCSNPSLIGEWDGTAKTLTLSAGTADVIEMSAQLHGTNWLLIVGEVNL